MSLVSGVGRGVLAIFREIGCAFLFLLRATIASVRPPFFVSQFGRQLLQVGYNSLPVIGLTAIFVGAAIALNTFRGSGQFDPELLVPNIVVLTITPELGPVLAGLMLSGRVGAAMAAEIGTMRVTEQIDALKTLSTDPMRFLIAPRLLAAVICLPLLVIIANIIAIMGGYLVSVYGLGFNAQRYLVNTFDFLKTEDIILGLVKAAVFGFIIAGMGCYHGFHSKGGALGVGRAATMAVVSAIVLILAANYVLTALWVR